MSKPPIYDDLYHNVVSRGRLMLSKSWWRVTNRMIELAKQGNVLGRFYGGRRK